MHTAERAQSSLEIREEGVSKREEQLQEEQIKTTRTNRNLLRGVGMQLGETCV